MSHPSMGEPGTSEPLSSELLQYLNTTPQLTTYLASLQRAGGGGLPPFISNANSSTPSTLFVPTNNAFSNANSTTRGYTFDMTDTTFLQALIYYHSAPGNWTFNEASPFHTIIPSSLQGMGYSDLDAGKPQVISCITTSGEAGGLTTTFPNQRQSTTVTETVTLPGYTIHVLDEVLGIPGQYDFEYSNSQLFQFEDLRNAVGALDFEDLDGFTAFAPGGDGLFFTEAQSRDPTTQQLSSLFKNHVIYGQTVWSSDFTAQTYTSLSGFNYTFSNTSDGNITISLNGITSNIIVADVLVSNGVIHILDDALWNLTPESGPSNTSSPSTMPSSSTTPVQTAAKAPAISSGIIAAIAVSIIAALILLSVAIFYMWRYHRAQGVRELARHRDEALDGSFTPTALRTSPFDSQVDVRQVPAGGVNPALTQSSNSIPTLIQKHSYGYRPDSATSDPSYGRASSSTPTQMQGLQMSEEVVERLLQTLVQRIDRGPATQLLVEDHTANAPPEYHSAE